MAYITSVAAAVVDHRGRDTPEALAMSEGTCQLAKHRNRGDRPYAAREAQGADHHQPQPNMPSCRHRRRSTRTATPRQDAEC